MNVYEQTRGCKNHDLLIVKATTPYFYADKIPSVIAHKGDLDLLD